MPDINGLELSKELKARKQENGNPFVIMISYGDNSQITEEAIQAGVDKFLLKPLFPSNIVDTICTYMGVENIRSDEGDEDINGIFRGHHILLAEDVDINREIVQILLEPTEVVIDCAVNGVEAVELFSRSPEKYEMIFMDVQMPEMDGYEATRIIRSMDSIYGKTVPVIAMTANVFREDIERCLACGMNDHVGKPLDFHAVLDQLSLYLK